MSSQISAFNLANLKIIPYKEMRTVEKTQEDVILTVKDLMGKLSVDKANQPVVEVLSHFPEETPFVRLFWYKDTVQISIPQVYKDEEEGISLYDVGAIPSPIKIPIKWLKYSLDWNRNQDPKQTIITGTQVFAINLNSENSSEMKVLICPVGLSKEYIKYIRDEQNKITDEDIPKGKGLVDGKYLNYYPRPLLPMALVEVNETYDVKEVIFEEDPRYSTPRYLVVKLNQDQEISEHEILANYYIRQHYHDFKNAPFVIRSKEKKGEGYSVKVGLRSLAMAS